MTLISCNNLTMGYDGKNVLDNLSFTVNEGDYLCIVGENGSGKTTLMRGLLGLISANKGELIFADNLKKNQIGYLPQQSTMQKGFPASVYEVILSGCLNKSRFCPFFTKKDKKRVMDCMERIGVANLKKQSFKDLSGGQQQRVMLARALCATEKLLVLDEPVTGLDPIATKEMYKLVKDLNDSGLTIIMVSHDINQVINYCDHVLHIDKDCSFFGTTHQYIHSEIGAEFLITECPCDDCHHSKEIEA